MKSQHKKGFTLLETLVALSILTSAVVGPLTLAFYSIRSAGLSQNQLTAFYLAQEAIEYVKNQRDNNVLQSNNWLQGLAPAGSPGNGLCRNNKGCTVDIPYDNIQICPSKKNCPKMRYSSDTGFYHQNASLGVESPFDREINLDYISSYEEKISVTITWKERFGTRSFTLEENIFNWP